MFWDIGIFFRFSIIVKTWNINFRFWFISSSNNIMQWHIGLLILIYWCSHGQGCHSSCNWLVPISWIFLKLAETVPLAPRREHHVPVLWNQLSPIVKTFNNEIVLGSFIHKTVERIKKFYYMLTYEYGIYHNYFNI